jgi:hypothetical protein
MPKPVSYRTMLARPSRDPLAVTPITLLTVEGEKDDICSLGQTLAATDLCGGRSGRFHTVRTPAPGCTQAQYGSVLLRRTIFHFSANRAQEIVLPPPHNLRGTINSRATPSGVWFGRNDGACLSRQQR